MTKLELRNISKYYEQNGQRIMALKNINLKIDDGEFVCLVGPSGCGKSTLLNIIAGLERPDEGEIILDGKPVYDTSPDRIMVFQEGALFPWLNVIDNIEFGLKIAGIEKSKRRERAMHYLKLMQLERFAESYIYQLSIGMRQRVAIARALVIDPEVLLMDEPFAALDAQTRDLLVVELQLIWQKTRKTILFVTHSTMESVCLGDRVIVFTNRPARIKQEISIDYKRPRLMEDQNLNIYASMVLDTLKSEVIPAMKSDTSL